MSKRKRSFFLMSLISASLLVSVVAVMHAQQAGAPAAKATNWSDPATWPNRKVPVAGDKVIIEKDKQVVLDVTPPALNGVTIDGKLSFANNKDVELTTEWIMLHGDDIIERGMVRAGRLTRLLVELTDLPGSLAAVAACIATTNANIEEVHHQRKFTHLPVQSAVVEFVLQTRDHAHGAEIVAALTAAGFVARLADGGK